MKTLRPIIAFALLGLVACGQKGPLYMPDIEKVRNKVEQAKKVETDAASEPQKESAVKKLNNNTSE